MKKYLIQKLSQMLDTTSCVFKKKEISKDRLELKFSEDNSLYLFLKNKYDKKNNSQN